MLFGSHIAAEAAGVPSVLLGANIYLFPRTGVPPFGPGFVPARTFLERTRERFVTVMSRTVFGKGGKALNEARAAFGLAPLTHPFDQLQLADGIIMLTSEEFDFPSLSETPRVHFAVPELEDPVWAGEWSSPWADGDSRPLVLVGMSSTFQDQTDLLKRVSAVLSKLPVRAVITTGPSLHPEDVPAAENVHVCKAAPHSKILSEASLMITHCGHGSVMRGLAAGVPLLCLPMGRDQNDNAARVIARGAGIRLSPKSTAQEIAAATQTLLGEPQYRESAKSLGARIRTDFENSTAVEMLERIAFAGSTPARKKQAV